MQGGYANGTAVTSHSDVDVVALPTKLAVRGVAEWESDEVHAFQEFRHEVLLALRTHLDRGTQDPRVAYKCVVKGQEVDVVPALRYEPADGSTPGIWFWIDEYIAEPQVSRPDVRRALIDERDRETDGAFRPVVRALKASGTICGSRRTGCRATPSRASPCWRARTFWTP